jgi:Ca2+-binding RTX toxin-like protein
LARNIGIKSSPDVSGEKNLTYTITTIDTDNPDTSISNIKTQSVELKINVKNINDLAFIDEATISADSTYFENPGLDFQLHKDAKIRDKEANNFFGGVLTIIIANVAGAALASERITLIKDSLYSIDDLQLKYDEEVIGSIKKNDASGLTIEFNEYGKTSLEKINNLVKDLQFYAPEIIEDGTRKISLSLNDGGGLNEFGESETTITRNLNLFVGQSGTVGNDTIDGSNDIDEALVGGLGSDTLAGSAGDFIDLQLEKDFFDLYSDTIRPDNYHNKVNLGVDNSENSQDFLMIKSELNKTYTENVPIDFNQSDVIDGKLTISGFTKNGDIQNVNDLDLFFLENMDGYVSETNLSNYITISENNLILDLLSLAKEQLAGLNSDNAKYNLQIQNLLGENGDDFLGNQVLTRIVENIKNNLIVKNKISLEEIFVSSGSMQLNASEDIDTINEIANVKGSEDQDHILGSASNNVIEGKSGNDIIYGGSGDDRILGGDGNDIISGGKGNDYIDGGSGDDVIYASTGLNSIELEGQTLIGGDGFDTLSFDNINNGVLLDFVFGIGTFDEVDALGNLGEDGIGEVIYFVLEGETYHSFEKIIGSKVNDFIVNLSPWDHFMEIFGGQGNDNLVGSYGDEILSGGLGNDIISGGYGVDRLSGGEGFDKFIILDDTPDQEFKKQWVLNNPDDEAIINADNIFKSEDVITDFEMGIDTIDLTSISNSNVNLSNDIDNNDLSIKKKNDDENNFDAVMEIKTSNIDVSVVLENFGTVSQETEEQFLQSILV